MMVEIKAKDLHDYIRMINQMQNELILCICGEGIGNGDVKVDSQRIKDCISHMRGLVGILEHGILHNKNHYIPGEIRENSNEL